MISQKELARLIQYNTLMNGSQNHADDNNTGFVLVQVSTNINDADLSEAGEFCKIRMANQLFRDTLGGFTD